MATVMFDKGFLKKINREMRRYLKRREKTHKYKKLMEVAELSGRQAGKTFAEFYAEQMYETMDREMRKTK